MKINADNTNINLRHLRAIHAVHATGSFARAADRLGVVPSALTEIVRQLEESAGAALFDRRMRPPQFTPLGLEFLQATAPALLALDDALEELRDSAALGRGRLQLGASPSTIKDLIAPALEVFRKAHPNIALSLQDGPAEDLAHRVISGALDLAVAGYAGHSPQLERIELDRDPVGLAVPKGHALTRLRRPLVLADIDPNDLIHLDAETGTSKLIADHAGLPKDLRTGPFRVASTFGQLCLIRSGAGVGLLPRKAALLFDDPQLTFLPISDLNLYRCMYLLLPATRPISHVAQRFAEVLQDPQRRARGSCKD